MFSYRHGFHAGNHADVLKHISLIAILRHLVQKDTALAVVDTHAGAGLYRLDSGETRRSGEAADGVLKLSTGVGQRPADPPLAPAIADYLSVLGAFNTAATVDVYPGSPFIIHHLLGERAQDKLWLFELHPSDMRALDGHLAQLKGGPSIAAARDNGFERLRALLPPPSRRGLILIDPSYEIKSDYSEVATTLQDSLKRFATGTYMVWYPLVARPQAHTLPRRLKTLTQQAGKPWLHATLSIGLPPREIASDSAPTSGLNASGVFMVNPPHTLRALLQAALPQLVQMLGRGRGQGFAVESG